MGGKKNPWSSFPWFLVSLVLSLSAYRALSGGGSLQAWRGQFQREELELHTRTRTPLSGRQRSPPPSVTAIQPFLERDTESNILKVGD